MSRETIRIEASCSCLMLPQFLYPMELYFPFSLALSAVYSRAYSRHNACLKLV